jgi:HlyD family secretion protein
MVTSVAPASRPRTEQPQPTPPAPKPSGSPVEGWATRSRILIAAAVIVVLAGLAWYFLHSKSAGATAYRFGVVQRGDVQQTVSSTGALSAVKTVQVGTQVSGKVVAEYADFNDHVTQGQLLARIDPTLQEQAVTDAQAQLARAQAQLAQARDEYNRNLPLFQEKFISASEFGTVQVNLSVAQAQVKSAQVTLDRAKQNLAYTNIYAPINGVVVERNVDVGQTVAASLSAPQLFLIAQDLSQMQILASVDESDISSIKEGQEAKFTVQSYPGRNFTGTVQQVRLQSKTTDNVVSYTVVVSVQNPNGVLLPGMTATVEFVTASAKDVLTVPNAALRFRPTPEELAASGLPDTAGTVTFGRRPGGAGGAGGAGASTGAARAAQGGGQGGFGGGGFGGGQGGPGGQGRAGGANRVRTRTGGPAVIWTVDASGKLKPIRVRSGISDGQHTQVSSQDPALKEGLKVIVGSSLASQAGNTPSSSPLTPQRGGPRGF